MLGFVLARTKASQMPRVRDLPVASGGAWNHGALLLVNGSGEFAECGADPAAVAAVALSEVGTGTGPFYPLGTRGFPPGMCQGVAVQDEVEFHAAYVGTLPAASGGSFGVVKDADGYWKVDFAETVATRVKLVDRRWTESPLNNNRVVVHFLPTVVQTI